MSHSIDTSDHNWDAEEKLFDLFQNIRYASDDETAQDATYAFNSYVAELTQAGHTVRKLNIPGCYSVTR